MPISFGFNANNKTRAFNYALVMMVFTVAQFICTITLLACQMSIFMFRMPNATSVVVDLYNDIPYEDCRCSFIPTKNCLTHRELQIARVLPLILFVLQVYLIREHFSFTGNHTYFLVNVYWIVYMFAFFGILVIINRSSYCYCWTATILTCMGFFLFTLLAPRRLSAD
jgi:hypothetical protein